MIRMLFAAPAEAVLARLQQDATQQVLYGRVCDVLDWIEDDPTDERVRLRRYRDPMMWGVVVRGPDADWLILWDQTDDLITILYIGPDLR
jgi:hypothetical protein